MQEAPSLREAARLLWWEQVLPLLRGVAGRVGQKSIAGELEVSEGLLSEVLNPQNIRTRSKNARRIAGEWLVVFLRLATPDERKAILSVLANDVGLVVKRKRVLTPEEELAALRSHLEMEAPGVLRGYDRGQR